MPTSAPMNTHPCPLCSRPTRRDGRCRTWNCLNRFPDPAEAREAALTKMRDIIRTARLNRTRSTHPMTVTTEQLESTPEADSAADR